MTKAFFLTLLAWAGAGAQSIAPPQLGFVVDGASVLRPAYGLAGNFILGPSVGSQIASAAFSGSVGLLKTDSSLAAFNSQGALLGSMKATPGPALFGFSPSGATALVYLESIHELVEWRGAGFAPVSVSCDEVRSDAVLAIAFPTPFEAVLIVQKSAMSGPQRPKDSSWDDIWEIHLPLGAAGSASQNALVGVRAPVLALPSGDLIFAGADGIVVRRPGAAEVHLAASLPANFSLQQISQDWVELRDLTGSARYAIHTTPGREGFYQLPE
jgi:hypothetical protein